VSASNLALRVLSAVVLAPLALFTAYLGDWPFALFWGAAALAVLWEWITLIVGPTYRVMFSSCGGALTIAGFLAWFGRPVAALLMVGLGALAATIFAPPDRRLWVTIGIGYAGALLLAPIILRADETYGFAVIVLLFAIVWTTDIIGYFAGRAFGGPKLLPAVSPKKTWSGAIAGTVADREPVRNIQQNCNSRCCIDLVGSGAVWGSVRIVGEAAVRRQRFQSTYSRARRRDGQARWFLGGCSSRLPHRAGPRRLRWACAWTVAMVNS
jgi:hypothetical protein